MTPVPIQIQPMCSRMPCQGQPGAADLEEGGDDEQGNGTSDGHTG
ncbi:hypothetical protein ACFYO0_00580 [Streptomyces sp. NPDC006365]